MANYLIVRSFQCFNFSLGHFDPHRKLNNIGFNPDKVSLGDGDFFSIKDPAMKVGNVLRLLGHCNVQLHRERWYALKPILQQSVKHPFYDELFDMTWHKHTEKQKRNIALHTLLCNSNQATQSNINNRKLIFKQPYIAFDNYF